MKEEYIKLRTQNEMPVSWFYNYFTSESGSNMGINNFSMLFLSGNMSEVINSLDKKFNLTLLMTADGSVIKVLE